MRALDGRGQQAAVASTRNRGCRGGCPLSTRGGSGAALREAAMSAPDASRAATHGARARGGMQQARTRRDKAAHPPATCDGSSASPVGAPSARACPLDTARVRQARGDWSALAEILWGIGVRLAAEREQSDERHGEEGTDR